MSHGQVKRHEEVGASADVLDEGLSLMIDLKILVVDVVVKTLKSYQLEYTVHLCPILTEG